MAASTQAIPNWWCMPQHRKHKNSNVHGAETTHGMNANFNKMALQEDLLPDLRMAVITNTKDGTTWQVETKQRPHFSTKQHSA